MRAPCGTVPTTIVGLESQLFHYGGDMKRRGDSHEVLNHLFAHSPVADLSMLKEALGTTSRTSVFRALAAAGYYASYSHTGRYYTIERIPEFNEDGIWAHDSVLFSRLRTLRATIIPMVAGAPSGQTHSELEARVHLRVYDTLHDLVSEGRIGRVEFERLYLFVNADQKAADVQVAERRRLLSSCDVPEVRLPGPTAIIEILLAFIRHPQEAVSGVAARVRRHGITQEQVVRVFAHYGLDKKKGRAWRPSPP